MYSKTKADSNKAYVKVFNAASKQTKRVHSLPNLVQITRPMRTLLLLSLSTSSHLKPKQHSQLSQLKLTFTWSSQEISLLMFWTHCGGLPMVKEQRQQELIAGSQTLSWNTSNPCRDKLKIPTKNSPRSYSQRLFQLFKLLLTRSPRLWTMKFHLCHLATKAPSPQLLLLLLLRRVLFKLSRNAQQQIPKLALKTLWVSLFSFSQALIFSSLA